jgi:hypothetical protein
MLKQISIGDTLREALEGGGSDLAVVVRRTYDYCDGHWSALKVSEQPIYQRCYLDSLEWVNETMAILEE